MEKRLRTRREFLDTLGKTAVAVDGAFAFLGVPRSQETEDIIKIGVVFEQSGAYAALGLKVLKVPFLLLKKLMLKVECLERKWK